MRAGGGGGSSSPKTVDRVLGVLVAACASALLVALGARAGASLTTLLRLAYEERFTARGKRRSARQEEHEEEGDPYFEHAYGSRSAARSRASREGSASDGSESRGGRLVLHLGSCHCGGLAFEVEAPEHLVAIEGPSKVRCWCGVVLDYGCLLHPWRWLAAGASREWFSAVAYLQLSVLLCGCCSYDEKNVSLQLSAVVGVGPHQLWVVGGLPSRPGGNGTQV